MRRIKTATLLLLTIMFVCPQKMWGQANYYDLYVTEYGQVEQALGDKWNTIDSLIVHGPIDAADFKTFIHFAKDGPLVILNLQYAQVKDNKIPDNAFFDVDLYYSGQHLDLRRIILPDNITEIGRDAFHRVALREINIPSSVRKLGILAFEEDKWLQTSPLIIPEGVTEIPARCFTSCRKLKKVVLPSTLKSIGTLAFHGAYVEEMNFPEGLGSIAFSAMAYTHLTEAVLPNTVRRLEDNVFEECPKLRRLVLPEGITEIPSDLCYGCRNLEEAEIPESVVRIKSGAFYDCVKLKTSLPPGIKWIEKEAFFMCALDSLVFPATVKYIGEEAFANLASLKKIYSESPIPPYCRNPDVNSSLDPFCGSTPKHIPVYVPIGSAESYRQAFGWSYFTNFIETDKFPTGIGFLQADCAEKCKVYGKDGRLTIEVSDALSSPLRYSVYSVSGEMIEQGSLAASHSLPVKSSGVYIVRVGKNVYKILM